MNQADRWDSEKKAQLQIHLLRQHHLQHRIFNIKMPHCWYCRGQIGVMDAERLNIRDNKDGEGWQGNRGVGFWSSALCNIQKSTVKTFSVGSCTKRLSGTEHLGQCFGDSKIGSVWHTSLWTGSLLARPVTQIDHCGQHSIRLQPQWQSEARHKTVGFDFHTTVTTSSLIGWHRSCFAIQPDHHGHSHHLSARLKGSPPSSTYLTSQPSLHTHISCFTPTSEPSYGFQLANLTSHQQHLYAACI